MKCSKVICREEASHTVQGHPYCRTHAFQIAAILSTTTTRPIDFRQIKVKKRAKRKVQEPKVQVSEEEVKKLEKELLG